MTKPFHKKIVAPGAWRGPEIQNDTSWILQLDARLVAEIDQSLEAAKANGSKIPFGAADFPLPSITAWIGDVSDRLENGPGLVLVRGLPRERYSDEDCELIYWGLVAHLGSVISQNAEGHLIGHVRDEGRELSDPTARGYQTKAKLDFHSDLLPVDVVGLFCVRTAKAGGRSYIVSALTLHNTLLEERSDLLDVLYAPFNLDWRGDEPPGEPPWHSIPMFTHFDGKLTSRLTGRAFYESVSRFGDELALTPLQREALDAVQEIAERPELRLSMDFQEGDMQFVNNHMILHAREEYTDHEDPVLRRHLLRMWIALPEASRRRLSPELAGRYRFVQAGGYPRKVAA